eukprot:1159284-Pelagomonas_calceolata.AAC.2
MHTTSTGTKAHLLSNNKQAMPQLVRSDTPKDTTLALELQASHAPASLMLLSGVQLKHLTDLAIGQHEGSGLHP